MKVKKKYPRLKHQAQKVPVGTWNPSGHYGSFMVETTYKIKCSCGRWLSDGYGRTGITAKEVRQAELQHRLDILEKRSRH